MKVLIILILLLLAGCKVQDDYREIKVLARQFEFEPSMIEVSQGEKVRLVLSSQDTTHGLSIPELGIDVRSEPGKNAPAEFIADKKGEFEGRCSVYCGAGHGDMKFKVVVT